MKNHFRRCLYSIAHNPFSYAVSLLIPLYAFFSWFYAGRIFSFDQVPDLFLFFSGVESILVFCIPFFVSTSWVKGECRLSLGPAELFLSRSAAVYAWTFFSIMLTAAIPACSSLFFYVDFSRVLCGYAGIALYLCFSCCMCVFVFSFLPWGSLSYFICSFLLLVLSRIHFVPAYFDLNDFMSDAIRWFSTAFHLSSFSKGIVSVGDILFFLSGALLFSCGYYVQQEFKKGKPVKTSFAELRPFIAGVFLVVLLAGIVPVKIDVTSSKSYSVSRYSREVLDQVDEVLQVTYYLSPRLKKYYPSTALVSEYLYSYCGGNRKISYRQVNVSSDETVRKLNEAGVYGQKIRTAKKGSETVTEVYSAVFIEYLGFREVIPFVLSQNSLEFDLTLRIQNLVDESKPLVQVVAGNGLDLQKDYSLSLSYLSSIGYVPVEWSGEKILPAVPLVVFGGSRLTSQQIKNIEMHILSGGKAFIAFQPYEVNIGTDWSALQNRSILEFQRMLFTFGIYFDERMIASSNCLELSLQQQNSANDTRTFGYCLWPILPAQENSPHGMALFWPGFFETDDEVAAIAGKSVRAFLKSSSNSFPMNKGTDWYVTNPFEVQRIVDDHDVEDDGERNIGAMVYDSDGKLNAVIFSDQYAFSTSMIKYSSGSVPDMRSLQFLGDCVMELSGREGLSRLRQNALASSAFYAMDSQQVIKNIEICLAVCLLVPLLCIMVVAILFIMIRKRILK